MIILERVCVLFRKMGAPSFDRWNQFIQVYAISNFILHLKYFITISYAANLDEHPPEDKAYFPGTAPENIKRRARTAGNDIENIPLHLCILWAAFIVQNISNMSGSGDQETIALTCLVVIYTALRIVYTAFYIFAIQPWRTVVFILSQLTMTATSCIMIASAFQVDTSKISHGFPTNSSHT